MDIFKFYFIQKIKLKLYKLNLQNLHKPINKYLM